MEESNAPKEVTPVTPATEQKDLKSIPLKERPLMHQGRIIVRNIAFDLRENHIIKHFKKCKGTID
jgi:hypothetical protein